MANKSTIKELQNMPEKDLAREVRSQRIQVAKLRMAVTLRKEKNIAKYRTEKKHLAKMLTVLSEKRQKSLLESRSNTTVPAQS